MRKREERGLLRKAGKRVNDNIHVNGERNEESSRPFPL